MNPYFRTTDCQVLLENHRIQLIGPEYAGTNLEAVFITPAIHAIFRQHDRYIILDVGGDDAGATALGGFAEQIMERQYDMFFVVNQYRMMSHTPTDATKLLSEIESSARLRATGLVNSSNLGDETTADDIVASRQYIHDIAKAVGLPIAFTCVRFGIEDISSENILKVENYTILPWRKSSHEEMERG